LFIIFSLHILRWRHFILTNYPVQISLCMEADDGRLYSNHYHPFLCSLVGLRITFLVLGEGCLQLSIWNAYSMESMWRRRIGYQRVLL
jgi:hypothetical protein